MSKRIYTLLVAIISAISFLYGIYFSQFHYDGTHFGLIYDQALDFADNKKPYKDFFSLYGFLAIYIHNLSIKILNQGLFSLVIFTNFIYALSFVALYLLSNKFLNNIYSLFIITIVLLIHPAPTYPWPNYIIYLTLLFSLLLIFEKKEYFFYFAAILFGLMVFIREAFLYHSLIFIMYILFINIFTPSKEFKKKYSLKKIIIFLTIFLLVISNFLLYFHKIGILENFYEYLRLPKIYLEIKNTNILELVLGLFVYLFSWNFFKFFDGSYILIFSLIFIINFFFILIISIKIVKKKKIKLLELELSLISLICLLFFSYALNEINIFRLICGASIGLINTVYIINKFLKRNNNNILFIIFIIAIFNLNFFNKSDANLLYKNKSEILNSTNNNLDHFFKFKFHKTSTENLKLLDFYFNNIKNNCSINHSLNYEMDVFPKIISRKYFSNIQMISWLTDYQSDVFIKYYDKNFYSNVKILMENNDLIIITNFLGQKKLQDILISNSKNINYKVYANLPFSYDQKKIIILAPVTCY